MQEPTILIQTQSENNTINSFLHKFIFDDTNLITRCIEESENDLNVYPKIILYGKEVTQRRYVGFFSDESIGYKYSNKLAKSKPLKPHLIMMLHKINQLFNANFNGILINKYNDGADYISPHSDDETNLDPIGVVSLSYGSTRTFRIRNKKTKKKFLDVQLQSNDLLLMGGNFQKEFTHEIPIQKSIQQPRISFTFRKHVI